MGRQFVVVGSGRSGTGYVAALLNHCGVSCGHEHVFDASVVLGRRDLRWQEYDADASWMATAKLPMLGLPAVLVLRHPLAVVRSKVELGFFRGDYEQRSFEQVVKRFRPEVFAEATEQDRALSWWIHANLHAAAHVDRIFRVEDFTAEDLRWIGERHGYAMRKAEDAMGAVSRRTNDKVELKRRSYAATWEKHRKPLRDLAQALARHWGYEP